MSDTFDRLGFGTYKLDDSDECAAAVAHAIKTGYRHIDTAQGYGNESDVAAGIDRTEVDRDDLFLATKLSTDNLGYDDVIQSAKASRDRLGVETIDLLYIHWPIRTYDPEETLPALEELRESGIIEHIGLSNFEPPQLQEANNVLDAPIFAHQVECHPLLQQQELREFAREDDHWLVAYSPIARNRVAQNQVIRSIADEYDATPAQISLAWLLAKENVAPIPKSAAFGHIEENWQAPEIDLGPEAIARIDDIEDEERIVDFANAPWNR